MDPRIEKWKKRPMSHSALSAFEYNPEEWLRKYILDIPVPENALMKFGKEFAKANENRTPLAPVTLLKHVEYHLKATYKDIELIGYADTYEPEHLVDHKTGEAVWDKKRADNHKQFDFYLFILMLTEQVIPDNVRCAIEHIPTVVNGDFTVSFKEKPVKVYRYETKRTTMQILKFGNYILEQRKKMEAYAVKRLAEIALTSNLSQV